MSLALISTSGTFTTEIVEGDKAETIAPIVSGAVVTASGTSVTFTGIPDWVKRITVMFSAVSTTGSSQVIIRIGSGALVTTGYISTATGFGATSLSTVNFTTGFSTEDAGLASYSRYGTFTLSRLAGTNWVFSGVGRRDIQAANICAGGLVLAGALDRVSITTVGGTETFDAGNINIMWE